ncbi:MAG: bifunctional DNA primase/polymerase [Halobacteriota archaeon]
MRTFKQTEQTLPPAWNYAAFMAEQGCKVFPVKRQDKAPLINGWQDKATTDQSFIAEWASQYPDCNYGVLTGNGLFVIDIDIDDPAGIEAEINKLHEELGSFELGTVVKTGRGCQLYCATLGVTIRNSTKRLTDKIDIKGDGGYVVGVGSVHPNGRSYEFKDPLTLEKGIALTKLPKAAVQYISSLNGSIHDRGDATKKGHREQNAGDNKSDDIYSSERISKGQRNDTLFRIGCYYRETYGLKEDALTAILVAKNKLCDPPLEPDELTAIAQSCASYPAGIPRHATTEVAKSNGFSDAIIDLFQDNRFIELVRNNVQKFHVGDEPVTELLMVSVASMSVINTKGTQPKLSGESGMGKTHGVQTMLHLMHSTIYRAASFSSKALFYDETLRPKTVIFSDDVNLAPDVEETVRAAMTNWYKPTEHMSLGDKRNPLILRLPPRIVFWLTSVDNKSTLQLQNRQVEMNVDESPDQDRRVEEHQRRLAELGLPDFYENDEVELLREAFLHLNQVDFSVKIPFIQNIKFTNVRNRRNLPIFLDFIKAYCVLNYRARIRHEDGALVAVKEDFDNALELFKTVAVQQVTKLSDKERNAALVIRDNSPCDIDIITDQTHLSNSYVYELIHGSKHSGNKGLREKIPELKFFSRRDTNPETGWPWGKNHYALPEDWSIVSSHEAIVYWEDKDADQLRSISDCFGDDFRNSSGGVEKLDEDLDPRSGGCSTTHTTCFGTSVERETPQTTNGSSPAVAPVRNTETALHPTPDTSETASKRATDPQSVGVSVSESPSETARNTTEVADVNLGALDLDHIIERVVTAIEITHRGQCLASDTLVAYVVNKVQEMDSSYDRDTIKKRFLVLAQQHEEIGHRVDLITKGEFPL